MPYTSRSVYEFISKQTSDPIIERKTCTISGTQFPVYQSDINFYHKISPTFAGQKFQIPTPTLCPEERQRRRSAFRNFFTLRKRVCAASGVTLISQYPEPYHVYNNQYRRSDSWDATEFRQEIDWSLSFTQQRQQLSLKVPRAATHTLNCENSNYCNMAANSKNCYIIGGCIGNEDCMYGHILWKSQSCLDMLYSKRCEQCYYCSDCLDCTGCSYSSQCEQCSFCVGCIGIIGKSYCIFNKQYSKEEYHTTINQLSTGEIISAIQELQQQVIKPGCKLINCESVYGNNNTESNNITQGYDTIQSEFSKYVYTVGNCTNCMDVCYTGLGGEQIYESLFPQGQQLYFVHNCQDNCYQVFYSENCYACTDCFGCIGLRNKQYYIFNRQYTKEEYEIQVAKIIQHMMTTGERGEFFHPSLSPFGYNETVAQEHYPLPEGLVIARNEIQGSDVAIQGAEINSDMDRHARTSLAMTINYSSFGYKWSNYSSDPKIPAGASTLTGNQIPPNITETSDDILKQVLICEISGRPYMIQKAELDFYRKHHLPVPRKHPDIRHDERMKIRPSRMLYLSKCNNCNQEMLSVYGSDNQGKVYCEQCYQKTI